MENFEIGDIIKYSDKAMGMSMSKKEIEICLERKWKVVMIQNSNKTTLIYIELINYHIDDVNSFHYYKMTLYPGDKKYYKLVTKKVTGHPLTKMFKF